MAHVLFFNFVSVQAQSSLSNSINSLCVIGETQNVDVFLEQAKPFTFTSNNDAATTIPKFFQFTCNQSESYLTVQINLTDGSNNQTITKDIEITSQIKLYEIPVLSLVNNELLRSGKAHIKSIVFKNNLISSVELSSINFTNVSSDYEVNLNQIFTIDLSEESQKNYFVTLQSDKDVNINLYKPNGEFDHTITKKISNGKSYIPFDDMQLNTTKYIVVVSDINLNRKISNDKITVMY